MPPSPTPATGVRTSDDADAHEVAVDGRTARRERNREAVLDAVIDLFAEDRLVPSPTQVAERSGVSLRSVYRYFEDEDSLVRSAITHNMERIRPYMALDRPGEGSLESRIRRTVAARLELFDRAAPLMRAVIHSSHSTPVLAARLRESRAEMREQVLGMFEPELAALRPPIRRETADIIDLVLSYEAMDQLRRSTGRDADAAGAVMRRMLRSALPG